MIQLKRCALILSLGVITALSLGACSESEPQAKIKFQPGQFVSAEQCGTCHKDIFTAWRGSLHAMATEDSIFKASYQEAIEQTGGEAKKLCLTCHAPTVVITNDYDMTQPITREGVTCDFCHSLKGTDLSNPGHPYELEVGPVKFGPIPDAVSTGHDVAFSEFHTSSLQCAGCHEYRNQHGVALLSTYSEWEHYRKGGGDQTCQQCHMPQVLASIVDPKVKRIEGAFVNLHYMPGGHSRDQLNRSLRLQIMEASKTAQGLKVKVRVSNVGAGHMVPTGSPTRKVILNLDVTTDQGRQFHDERIYQRTILDEQSQVIRRDSRIFFEAHSIESDTRLAPGEQRTEEFLLPVSENENVTVTATLTYFYSPLDRKETEKRVDFISEKKELLSKWVR